MKVVKNKHAPPFKTAQFELEFGKGICRESELIDLGCKYKFITKGGGGNYSYNGQGFRGKDAFKRFLSENDSEREELVMKLREKLVGETDKDKESEAEAVDEDLAEGINPSDTSTTDEEVTAVEA